MYAVVSQLESTKMKRGPKQTDWQRVEVSQSEIYQVTVGRHSVTNRYECSVL